METLSEQFDDALTRIEVNGDKRQRAIEAHTEIRAVLEADAGLVAWGVDTVLIGSYARHTGVYPGKDVDVFVRLTELDTGADPGEVFEAVKAVLVAHYGDRAEPQRRSVKVAFEDDGFAVDAVPAVRSAEHWAIPNRETEQWGDPGSERWMDTDPLRLGALVSDMNAGPKVGDRGAFVPTVKLVRQVREHHLGERKPGGLYLELSTYWAFAAGIDGDSFAEVLAASLRAVAAQLASGAELMDPALARPYSPSPEPDDLAHAAQVFDELAASAEAALSMERCPAGAAWRQILGENDRGWCFPLPDGCDEAGQRIRSVRSVAPVGSGEAGGFA